MSPVAVLVALADPTRCRIVEILRDGPQPVHVLASSFDISRPAISRHLRVLKEARLISEKKAGRENRYALHPNRLKPVQDWLAGVASATEVKAKGRAAKSAPQPAPVIVPAPEVVPELVVVAPRAKAQAKPKTAPKTRVAKVAAQDVPAKPDPAPKAEVSQMGFDF